MRLAVTGATGFIGGAIVREAIGRGHEVTSLHRGEAVSLPAGVQSMPFDDWLRASTPLDAIIHAAALRHRHGVSPADYGRVNLQLTARVVDRARRARAAISHISSIAVYGWPRSDRLPIDESFPYAPVGPYGRSKVDSEEFVAGSGVPFTIIQPSITYGPGDTSGMIDRMMRLVARRVFVVPGLGSTRVQLVHIDDLARIVLDATESRRAEGQRFICTYRDPIRVRDLVSLIARRVGVRIPAVGPPVSVLRTAARAFEALDALGAFRGGQPPLTREKLATISVDRAYRIDAMRRLLGTEPRIGYAEGLSSTARALGLAPTKRRFGSGTRHRW